MRVDALECGGIERENTPRCTRYAFQWAGYQRRIHPTFHAGMHFCPFFSFFLSLTLRGVKARSYSCVTLEKHMDTRGTGVGQWHRFQSDQMKGNALDGNKSPILSSSSFPLRIINTTAVGFYYDRITLNGFAAGKERERKKNTIKKERGKFYDWNYPWICAIP